MLLEKSEKGKRREVVQSVKMVYDATGSELNDLRPTFLTKITVNERPPRNQTKLTLIIGRS